MGKLGVGLDGLDSNYLAITFRNRTTETGSVEADSRKNIRLVGYAKNSYIDPFNPQNPVKSYMKEMFYSSFSFEKVRLQEVKIQWSQFRQNTFSYSSETIDRI